MRTLYRFAALGFLSLIFLSLSISPVQAQMGPLPDFTLFVRQVEASGLVRISWTDIRNTPGVEFAMFYVYRASVPFADSSSFTLIDTTKEQDFEDHLPNLTIAVGSKYAYFVIGRTTLGLTKKTNTVTVEVPGVSSGNAFRLEAKANDGVVQLKWGRPSVSLSTPFSVFRININTPGPPMPPIDPAMGGDTILVATTSDTLYVDTLPPVLWSMSPLQRVFVYYVSAKTTENVLIQSCLASVFSAGPDHRDDLKIVSTPIVTAQIGVQYIYDVNAVSSNPAAVIRYHVENPLSSIFIQCDTISGVVTFTSAYKRVVPIHVVASSNLGGRADQEFQVTVSNANGIISGKVTDTLTHPIKGVLIQLLKRDAHSAFSYQAVTDSLGSYRITHIDLGSYFVHAIPLNGDYVDQWYNGASSPLDATPVNILDTLSPSTADFRLRLRTAHPLLTFTVQGTVSDTLGLPLSIAGTQVFFVNADFALNAAGLRDYLELNRDVDFRIKGNSKFVFKASVDSLGQYSAKIPAGAYVAFAVAPGYSMQFYQGKSYFLVADVIKLTADMPGINFSLSALPPVVLGEISGQVLDSVKNAGVRARLIAFRAVWTFAADPYAVRAFFTETDSTGAYAFTDLLPGVYYILALPVGNYAPVFYSNGSQGLRWDKATGITMSGNTISGINLYPRPLADSARGYTMIKGSVSHSGGSSGAFGGAMVFAGYPNGEIAGYTLSDGQGKFVIDGLAPGSYSVSADVPGYTLVSSAQTSPSYDGAGNAVAGNVSLTLKTTSVQTITNALPTGYSLDQNYPNPFNPTTTIRYTLPLSGRVSVRVFNILGQLVTTLVDGNQVAGTYQATFNASSLSSGIYFYRIESGKYVAVKKMMLLK